MHPDINIYVKTESIAEETTSKMDDIISNDMDNNGTEANPEKLA